ncbi:hypothetical protein DIE08_17565 [Burkholderia sp. Bp9004]|nr:hypothetical protein DIE08_17565 [Burkholderia sp. Bp9004]
MEETCGGCRSATTNEAHYTNAPPTSQENLHYEISHHDAKYGEFQGRARFLFKNQSIGKNNATGNPAHLE